MISKTRKIVITAALVAAFGTGFATKAMADQPLMHSALDKLREARADLAHATADKGGHRVKALAAIDSAIEEVKAGIGFDRVH